MAKENLDVTVLTPTRWRSWPLRENPARAAAVIAGLVALASAVAAIAGSVTLTILATAAMLIALWRFFLPVTFEVNEDGVQQMLFSRGYRLPWQAIRYYRPARRGVLLVPRGQRTEMAPFGSLYLPWDGHRAEVMLFVEHFLKPQS
jgi:hypothetical protein